MTTAGPIRTPAGRLASYRTDRPVFAAIGGSSWSDVTGRAFYRPARTTAGRG